MPRYQKTTIIFLILISIIVGFGLAFSQKSYRTYIVPKIETEDESLKEFEKTMRRHFDDVARRLDDLERSR